MYAGATGLQLSLPPATPAVAGGHGSRPHAAKLNCNVIRA